ncbi:MAG: SemiSWEET family sugar transporter [Myxococcales bacterium]|nr:SemiSWEET family sugar transporter [Myxococcales bacterium]
MPPAHDLLGYAAAVCSAISFIPQAVKVIRTGETKDLSLAMYVFTTLGLGMWCAYGFWTRAWPVAICNGLTVLFASVILAMKLRNYKRDASFAQDGERPAVAASA